VKEIHCGSIGVLVGMMLGAGALAGPGWACAQEAPTAGSAEAGPPPSNGGVFPLVDVRRGMMATAWTVFQGDKPEPMQVEILGVLRGARGPGQDMILAQLHGAKPEYTGVVAGMSGSPVYIGKRLLGSLSYRIGSFSKDPIAGITPIQQMLEVAKQESGTEIQGAATEKQGSGARDEGVVGSGSGRSVQADGMNFQAMETPLVMAGFGPEAVRLWQKQMAGTGLETVNAGGVSGASGSAEAPGSANASGLADTGDEPSMAAAATIVPGSAVSMQLVRGDVEIAATCTVTYVDAKQLLACGHPVLQAGPVSLPMTTTEVVATLASPLNAFKIVNTGQLIGTFTDDRESAIRGVFGQKPRMIPVHVAIHSAMGDRKVNVEVLDLPSLTPQAMLVSLYQALLENNRSSAETSYHLTGRIELTNYPASPLDEWVSASDAGSAPLELALNTGVRFARIYSNGQRMGTVRGITLNVEEISKRVQVDLETVRLVSGDIVRPGATVMVEATVRGWQEPARNVRIPVKLPGRLAEGNLRILVSDAGTLDRALEQPKFSARPANLDAVLAEARKRHQADRIFVSLLLPETQGDVQGQSLTGLPLSVANTLEPLRSAQDVNLNGESAALAADAPAGGVLSGFQILNVHIQPGGGLD
jgi:hypothetical protein